MNLKQLQYFLAVIEHESFSQAARALDIAQPALSRQVRRLEVELKQNLLQRTGRGVKSTKAGELMAKHARIILQSVATAQVEMNEARGVVSGHVAIGIPSSLSKLMAVSLVNYLKTHLPEITVSLTDNLSISTQQQIEDGRLDIAIIFEPQPNRDVDITPLMKQALFLVSKASVNGKETSPISLTEVADKPLVTPRSPHGIRLLIESAMQKINKKPNVSIEADSIHMILEYVLETNSSAILPLHSIAYYADLGLFSYRLIVEPHLHSQLCSVILARHPVNSKQHIVQQAINTFCRTELIINIKKALKIASGNLSEADLLRLAPLDTVKLI